MNAVTDPARVNEPTAGPSRVHPLARMILRRCALGLLTLLLVSAVVFWATEVLPGDAARAVLGRTATPQRLQALRRELGLDHPAFTEYRIWLSNLFHGNPGLSLATGGSAWSVVRPRLVNSLFLLAVTAVVGIPISVAGGIWAAAKRDRPLDHITSLFALAVAAMPEFVIGLALIVVFATNVLQVVPPVATVAPGEYPWNQLTLIILPVATLLVAIFPYIFRMMRASMVEALESEYVEMARLNGVPWRTLVLRHALPNALAPTIQVIALTFAYLAGGVVVVEVVFDYPGIGQGLVNAVSVRDIPVIQLIILLLAAFYVSLNVLADVLAVLVTPRLRSTSGRM